MSSLYYIVIAKGEEKMNFLEEQKKSFCEYQKEKSESEKDSELPNISLLYNLFAFLQNLFLH